MVCGAHGWYLQLGYYLWLVGILRYMIRVDGSHGNDFVFMYVYFADLLFWYCWEFNDYYDHVLVLVHSLRVALDHSVSSLLDV